MGSPVQQPQAPPQGRSQPPQPPAPKPYVPTPEEQAYLAECGKAIAAGCDAAVSAAASSNGGEYAQFAVGVKDLVAAYTAIKSGGKVSQHQGS